MIFNIIASQSWYRGADAGTTTFTAAQRIPKQVRKEYFLVY